MSSACTPRVLNVDDELREHDCHAAMTGGVADVLLLGLRAWRLDHELLGVRVEARRAQIALVMGLGSEPLNGAAPESELDARGR